MGNENCKTGDGCSCGCGDGGCQCGCGCEDEWDLKEELDELAEKAWMNVVRKKMEAAIEKESGKKLDKVAQLAVEHAMKTWKMMMENERMEESEEDEYEKKLDEAMGK